MALSLTTRGTKTLAYALQATNTLVSDSFSPAAGALVVCMFEEVTDDTTSSLTMSSTLTGQGAWTQAGLAYYNGFEYQVSRIAWSVCGAAPGTGTVTATRRAGSFNMGMFAEFLELGGVDTAAPVVQQITNSGASSSLALNFASSPLASSITLFSICEGQQNPVTPSGTTALAEHNIVSTFWGDHAYDTTPAQNNSWTGLGAFAQCGTAIEVADSPGSALATRRGLYVPGLAGRSTPGKW